MITFDMSINVTYETLKPHLPEIAKYIAKELEIDFHQVRKYFPSGEVFKLEAVFCIVKCGSLCLVYLWQRLLFWLILLSECR